MVKGLSYLIVRWGPVKHFFPLFFTVKDSKFATAGYSCFVLFCQEVFFSSMPVLDFAAHQDEIRASTISVPNDNLFLTGGYDHKVRCCIFSGEISCSIIFWA